MVSTEKSEELVGEGDSSNSNYRRELISLVVFSIFLCVQPAYIETLTVLVDDGVSCATYVLLSSKCCEKIS